MLESTSGSGQRRNARPEVKLLLVAHGTCFCIVRVVRRSFGVRVIKPSPVLKAVGPLFDHKDNAVRDGAKDLAVRTMPLDSTLVCSHSDGATDVETPMCPPVRRSS